MSSVPLCIVALQPWNRQAEAAGAKFLAAIQVASVTARLKALRVTSVPCQLVHHATDIVFAAVGDAGALDQNQTMRPQHLLVGVAVDLALGGDKPAGLIA